MANTPNLPLVEIPQGSFNIATPHNESMQTLDALVQLSVINSGLSVPPSTVAADAGKRWIVGAAPTGAWAGKASQVALCVGENLWKFFVPKNGWIARNISTAAFVAFDGSAWVAFGGGGGGGVIDKGLISGLALEYVSPNQIRLTSGIAFVPSISAYVELAASATKTLTLSANAWFHVYFKADADFEAVATAPAAPYFGRARTMTGDTSRRYVGSFKTNASSQILKFSHVPADGSIAYNENIGGAPFVVVNGGSQTVPTTVDCSGVVPVTAKKANTVILNAASSSSAYLHISNSDGPTPGAGGGFLGLVSPNSVGSTPVTLDSNQRYTYAYEAAVGSGGCFHRVGGYVFER